jgi:hypothetical protein
MMDFCTSESINANFLRGRILLNAMYTIGGVVVGASTVMAVNNSGNGWGLGIVTGMAIVLVAGIMEYYVSTRR